MKTLPTGTRVRMSEQLKANLRVNCTPEIHVGPMIEYGSGEPDSEIRCIGCSIDHLEEFQDCIGIVIGPVDYNDVRKPWSPDKVGPEIDVRWQPSQLKYGYHPDLLEIVE